MNRIALPFWLPSLRITLIRSYASTPKDYTLLIRKNNVEGFCAECITKVGGKPSHANQLAQLLVAADYRGHYSHGLNRLEMYVMDIEKGVCETNKEPVIIKETLSTAFINGNNVLGPVVGNFAMKLAIKKAKETGIAWIAANGSNHYGITGWYSMLAASEGLLGLSLTNTSPLVLPTRSRQTAIGTNPLSLAAPASNSCDDFVLDMATSAVALGKLEMRRRNSLPIPDGWAADKDGKSTTDPDKAIQQGGLLPLGGVELTGGYKGYGLGMLVELLCGILTGSSYGPHVRNWMNTTKPANLGQSFAAINPEVFAPGFKDRLSTFVHELRNLPQSESGLPVLVPGDPEREHMAEVDSGNGILYPPPLIDSLNKLADRLQIPRLSVTSTK